MNEKLRFNLFEHIICFDITVIGIFRLINKKKSAEAACASVSLIKLAHFIFRSRKSIAVYIVIRRNKVHTVFVRIFHSIFVVFNRCPADTVNKVDSRIRYESELLIIQQLVPARTVNRSYNSVGYVSVAFLNVYIAYKEQPCNCVNYRKRCFADIPGVNNTVFKARRLRISHSPFNIRCEIIYCFGLEIKALIY